MGGIRPQVDNPDALVAAVAAQHYGIITFEQLIGAGFSPSQIRNRVRSGRLHRIHRGVYAVGHRAISHHGHWMAAVRAGGPGTALSHRAGTELWQLLSPSRGDIDITVHGRGGRKPRKGLRIHRSHLPEHEITIRHRIPVTTPARTLIDLRRVAAPEIYRRALRQAEFKGMDLTGLETDGTRSEPEADFLRLCRRHRLPSPGVNQRIGPFTVDFLWRRERVVVEVDGWGPIVGARRSRTTTSAT